MFDEKQRRRDKWNQKKSFRQKDRFRNKRSHAPRASEDYNQFSEEPDATFVPELDEKDVDN